MAKRFTDTNKYKKPFIRGLKAPYKLLWDYLYHDCDHAGIWIVDFDIAQIYVGADVPINKKDALMYFNEFETKVMEIDGGKKWFIPGFISFQYGELNPSNRAHQSVIRILESYNLIKENKVLITPLQGGKDKDKDKVKDMDKDKTRARNFETVVWPTFDDFWDEYDKKRGDKSKIKKKWDKLAQDTKEQIMQHIPLYKQSTPDKRFRKDPMTFFNNRSWEDELIFSSETKGVNAGILLNQQHNAGS